MDYLDEIYKMLNKDIENLIKEYVKKNNEVLQEIRLRAKRPLLIKTNKGKYFIKNMHNNFIVTNRHINESVEKLSGYSLYAFEEELKQGYITIKGGHRVGFCGKAIIENGKVKTLRNISSLNIRVASEIKDCAKWLIPYLYDGDRLSNVIIVSPPGMGKTTLLRDIIRLLSDSMLNVSIVDERGEIACMSDGVPQVDIGLCSDVWENCKKADAMMFLLRSMSPDIIAADELGRDEDFISVKEILNSGITLISTIHGNNFFELVKNEGFKLMLEHMENAKIIVLGQEVGRVLEILNIKGEIIYKRGDGL